MIAGGRTNVRQELKETAPEVKGQANLRHATKWIHRHFAAWNRIGQRGGKGRSEAGITVRIVAVLVTREVIEVVVFPEVVVVLGEAVADAKE